VVVAYCQADHGCDLADQLNLPAAAGCRWCRDRSGGASCSFSVTWRGGALVVPKNTVLLHLPPYSPELNTMQNVWDYLRQNKLCDLVWDSYDDIVEACKTAWNRRIADPARITSIGTRDRACVSVQADWFKTSRR